MMDADSERLLRAEELAILHAIVEHGNAPEVRRAQIVLGWGEDLGTEGIAQQVGLSTRTVSNWVREFERKRLSIFDDDLIAALSRAQPDEAARISIEQLCRDYDVDMNHGVHVGQLARRLLELTGPLHNLDERYGDLIYFAGLLHNVAYAGGVRAHHTRGRDILLNTPLNDLDDGDRALIAVTTAFHRKPWNSDRLQREVSYTALDESLQPTARWLSALIRIADGLDYAGSQRTQIASAQVGHEGCEVIVEGGPQVEIDAARADEKADMWRAVTGIPLHVISAREAERRARRPHVSKRPARLEIAPDESMYEAGRKTLHFHLQRMLYYEPGTRLGEDIEALHDMRVATRRMRAALRLFGPYFERKTRKWIQDGLQRTGNRLGAVRDWDVALDHARAFGNALPEDARPGLESLLQRWEKQRARAQRQMLDYLESDTYVDFVVRYLRFCEKTDASKGQATPRVAHAAPTLIYQHYEAVRAYEAGLAEASISTLHALRIDIKRLRYALEFFESALGSQAREAINELVAGQDHLGALHDADVAIPLIKQTRKKEHLPDDVDDGASLYLKARQDELQRLQETAPAAFQNLVTADFRHKLALAVGTL